METLKSAFTHTFSGDATNAQIGLVFLTIVPFIVTFIALFVHVSAY